VSVSDFFKSVNIWKSYKQERGCLMHFAHLHGQRTPKSQKSARDNHGSFFTELLKQLYSFIISPSYMIAQNKRINTAKIN